MQEQQAEKPPAQAVPNPEDIPDCLQCLIVMYGDMHIHTLAELLNLTAFAETRFSSFCLQRRLR